MWPKWTLIDSARVSTDGECCSFSLVATRPVHSNSARNECKSCQKKDGKMFVNSKFVFFSMQLGVVEVGVGLES